jgi:hypothetical protein
MGRGLFLVDARSFETSSGFAARPSGIGLR